MWSSCKQTVKLNAVDTVSSQFHGLDISCPKHIEMNMGWTEMVLLVVIQMPLNWSTDKSTVIVITTTN